MLRIHILDIKFYLVHLISVIFGRERMWVKQIFVCFPSVYLGNADVIFRSGVGYQFYWNSVGARIENVEDPREIKA